MQYLDGKTTVTHIIASSLTPKKKIEFRKYRIVKPAWVVDSVKAGKLLSWENYKVVDEGVNQKVLGFDNGKVVSQASTQNTGYKEQMNTSWYTGQVKDEADLLNKGPIDKAALRPEPPQLKNYDGQSTSKSGQENKATPGPVGRCGFEIRIPITNLLRNSKTTRGGTESLLPSKTEDETPLPKPTTPEPPIHRHTDHGIKSKPFRGYAAEIPESENEEEALSPQTAIIAPEPPQTPSTDQYKLPGEAPVSEVPKPTESKPSITAEEHNANLLADPRVWKSTVVNPDFLKQYYEESRLHHLSTWKAELKSKLQALALERSMSQKARRMTPGSRRYILHVDFDCFFAAVSLKKFPQYTDKPAVVAHGGGSGSEIASCNYIARKFGVKNGMWMKTAQQLCPDLKVLPYDFKAYEDASQHFYEAAMDSGGIVQSVSVDECLIDISFDCAEAGGHGGKAIAEGSIWREQAKANEIATEIRKRVKKETGCDVSIGIGANILLAKVATRKAKPTGQYQILPEEVLEFIGSLPVQDLPGVAYSIGGKLEQVGVKLVGDLRELTKEKLVTTLGPKTGQKMWDYSRGIDRTEVGEQVVRKSVSAEVNWGIRFTTQEQADEFVQSLCEELQKRLLNEGVKGRQLTMKIMRKSADAPLDPPKHLGHGKCDTFNKSVVLGVATNSGGVLGREAISIMRGWAFPPGELRGIGVQVTKLEPLKDIEDAGLESSQRRLQFFKTATQAKKQVEDPIDEIESPQKPEISGGHPAVSLITSKLNDESAAFLNTLGTQFVLPTQVDPAVLAELPKDIQSRLLPASNPPAQKNDQSTNSTVNSRPQSPKIQPTALPSLSQLDQETLDALPPDVLAEVMAYYRSPQKARQTVLPQTPRKNRYVNLPTKKATPTKKRTGLGGRGKPSSKHDGDSTLTQSNFISLRGAPGKSNETAPGGFDDIEEVSADFLAALPEDVRQEVLLEHRRAKLKKRGGIDLATKRKLLRRPEIRGQTTIRLAPQAPRPTFTGKKLSDLPQLREAISSWVEEFNDEAPYQEDIEALVTYIRRVIIEERNMAKAVDVVKWLEWVAEEGDVMHLWAEALKLVQDSVQLAAAERDVARIVL
jgi:DNA repair protein REV1